MINKATGKRYRAPLILIQCPSCSKFRVVLKRYDKQHSRCRVCANKRLPHPKGRKSKQWTGSKYFSGSRIADIRIQAKKRGIEYNLTHADLDKLWEDALSRNKECPLTGDIMTLEKNHPNKASLDRIDSDGCYEITNCRFVTQEINKMKWKNSDDSLLVLACKIINTAIKRQKGITIDNVE